MRGFDAAHDFWLNQAHIDADAKALANRLRLELPGGKVVFGMVGGLMYPVRRLVVTGEDTPANFRTLFGPGWESCIPDVWKKVSTLRCSRAFEGSKEKEC